MLLHKYHSEINGLGVAAVPAYLVSDIYLHMAHDR
jgi:hypothetical protein